MFVNDELTPLGEKTPSVPPSSLMDTPISASRDSLSEMQTHRDLNSLVSSVNHVTVITKATSELQTQTPTVT